MSSVTLGSTEVGILQAQPANFQITLGRSCRYLPKTADIFFFKCLNKSLLVKNGFNSFLKCGFIPVD